MKPSERSVVFKKSSTNDYQAALDLALSSHDEKVREALECSYLDPLPSKN
jgi:hypothetical protein